MRASDPKITWAFIIIASIFLLQCQCFIVGNMAYGLQHLLNHNKPRILKEFAPPVVRGRRNSYRPREIKMRMIRFGKRGEVIQHYSPLDRDSTSSRAKRDFWLPSGFWWPKDSRHQRFVKFLYLFKNTRPDEAIKKKEMNIQDNKNNSNMFPMLPIWN